MPFSNPILGGETLIRNSIQSEDYVAGISGWAIFRNGSAEFNDGTFRGDVLVRDVNGAYVWIRNAQGGYILFNPANLTPPDSVAAGFVGVSALGGASGRAQMQIQTPSFDNGVTTYIGPTIELNTSSPDGSASEVRLRFGNVIVDDGVFRIGTLEIKQTPTTTVEIDGQDIGRGWVAGGSLTASSTPVGAVETTAISCLDKAGNPYTYKKGRSYKIDFCGSVASSAANTDVLLRFRKTNPAGQQINVGRTPCRALATSYIGDFGAYFTVGAADVTATIVVTVTGTGASNGQISAAATSPAQANIYDHGIAAYQPNAAVLV